MSTETWYLLFTGRSRDRAVDDTTEFASRTTECEVARKFLAKCRLDPFNIGYVVMVTDHTYRMAHHADSLK